MKRACVTHFRKWESHAWIVAHRYQISTIYDALYVALADLHLVPMWTADQRLVRTVGDASLVRWIGDYQG
jgi:predicted nucleic acid-binding protein